MSTRKEFRCYLLSGLWLMQAVATANAWFSLPPGAGITTVLDSADNQFCWYAGPGDQQEWLINKGANSAIRIKGNQDVTGLKFNLSAYRGQRVVAAELHLARANTDLVTSLAAATINTDWAENSACWRYRSTSNEWTYTNSDFTTATFGNYGSLTCFGFSNAATFRVYTTNSYTWIALALDPAVVNALILDQYGLAVTDPRLHSAFAGNPTVYTREQNSTLQPRLYIQFATNTDFTAPAQVGGLAAVPAGEDGSVELQFTAPSDPDDAKAFGYNVRYSTGDVFATATDAERWRIPRPVVPGATQRVLLERLAPGTNYAFFVQAYDAVGNTGTPAKIRFTLPAPAVIPRLADGGLMLPNPTGLTVRTAGGVLRYFGASEVAQINPATGNTIEDGYTGSGADNYKKANMVWNAASNTLFLSGCRNEVVGAQLILQRLGASLNGIGVTVSDLTAPGGASIAASPNIERFQMHYIASGGSAYAEAAIPLAAPFPTTFNIPDANHNAGGTYQSVYLDFFIPPGTAAGLYTGTVSVSATALGAENPVRIGLQLRVSNVAIPDRISFEVDLNGYGNPWDLVADTTATCQQYFQTIHKHRATANTLAYNWTGAANYTDRRPDLTGNGPTRQASSWTAFDNKYGRFFTTNAAQSAFNSAHGYTGPGVNTPVTRFYTTFNEMWPQSMLDTTYGFDAAGAGPAYWDGLRAAGSYTTLFPACPDVRTAFPSGYRQAQINVMSNWLAHASAAGWTQTAFENYLNNKFTYTGTHSLWVLEENETADDFRATGCFQEMWRAGLAASGITNVLWHFRIDISDRWGQHWGELDNRVNFLCMGAGAAGWHWPSKKYRRYGLDADKQEDWIWYGLGAPVAGSGTANARTFLQKWCQGFNGGLPYWDSYNTQWVNADDSTPCVVYSGQSVPGFGTYSGPVMSRRVKQMRQAQQIVELLNLWSACRGMNRSRVRNALNATYGQGTWDYAFGTLDEMKLYQLHAGLVAQLETQPAPLKIARVDSAAGSSMVLYWPSLSNCTYTVLRATNLVAGTFQSVGSAVSATPPSNVYTAAPASYPAAFHKLQEQWY